MVTVAGLGLWLAAIVLVPAPLVVRLFLVAPLVLVPRLLTMAPRFGVVPRFGDVRRLGGWPSLLAAMPLIIALGQPPGPIAVAFAIPWSVVAGLCGTAAVLRAPSSVRALLEDRAIGPVAADAALGILGVGGVFLIFDRLAIRPLGLDPQIIFLTAVHFHVVGFALGTLGVLAAGGSTRRLVDVGLLVLIVGIAITAAGFALTSSIIGWLGSLGVGLGALSIAVTLMWRSPSAARMRRVGLFLGGAALVAGVPLGVAWATATMLGVSFLDIDIMVRTHGALNLAGVLLATLSWPADGRP